MTIEIISNEQVRCKDLMIDLETLDTTPDAAVVSIGAVFFEPATGQLGEGFYSILDSTASMIDGQPNRTRSSDTLEWWRKQSYDVQKPMLLSTGMATVLPGVGDYSTPAFEAMDAFRSWVKTQCSINEVRVWANGASFDLPILTSLGSDVGHRAPWKFYNERCFRTLKSFRPKAHEMIPREGNHHNAYDDAVWQADAAMDIMAASGLVEKEK